MSERGAALIFAAMQALDFSVDPALARLLRGSFARELCRSIEGYVRRCGMSASGFGRAVLDDSSFVSHRLRKGGRVKLDTADRIRAYIGEQTFRPVLLLEIEVFLAVSGIAGWIAGEQAVRQRAFVARLRTGASPLLRTIDRFRRWMRKHLNAAQREAVAVEVARALATEPKFGQDGRGKRMEGRE